MQGRFGMKPYRFTGCIFSINPDAHSTSEIDLTRWGLAMARKGGVPRERVLNALDLSSFREYLRTRKKMCGSNEQAPAPLTRFGVAY
jgi:DNA polymerase (family 10)